MNFNTVLILVGILISAILIVENMVTNTVAFVIIWNSKTWLLSLVSIGAGILIGFGLKGMMSEQDRNEDESFDF